MRTLVTGATGYIGRRLVDALQTLGHDVRVLVRQPTDSFANVEQIVGNLASPESLSQLTSDMEVVFHLGGGMRPADGDLTAVNVRGTLRLMQDAKDHGVRRFVFMSAGVVYGDILNPPASEDAPVNPLPGHVYALSKLEAEQGLLALGDRQTDLVVVRIPQVYSAGSPSLARFPQLAMAVEGTNLTHFVHREDVIRGLLLLSDSQSPAGIYNLADEHPMPVKTAARIIETSMGGSMQMRNMGGGRAIPPMLQRVMAATLVLDTTKVSELGFSPQYPSLQDGLNHDR